MSLGSLSEAACLFDAEELKSIIEQLGQELQPLATDPRLADVRHTLTLVDGTLMNSLPKILALIYQDRWTIEIFFRFFKQILGCRHLFFHNENGIKLQAYCAIIASMLICLWTGRKPNKRTCEMICYYFLGLASEQELRDHLGELPAQEFPYNTAKVA